MNIYEPLPADCWHREYNGTKIKKAEIIAVTNENSHFSSSCEDMAIEARERHQTPPATSVPLTYVHNLLH